MNSNEEWLANARAEKARASIENMIALVLQADECRRVIRKQAWHQGSWEAVFQEATTMKAALQFLHEELTTSWAEITDIMESRKEPAPDALATRETMIQLMRGQKE